MTALIPLGNRRSSDTIAWRDGRHITVAEFQRDIEQTARSLAPASYAINACEDRYAFMVLFFAVCRAGQTNLLPANRASQSIEQLLKDYPDAHVVTDVSLRRGNTADGASISAIALPGNHLCAIAFTSGTTGAPQPNPKSWNALSSAARMHVRYLNDAVPLTPHHTLVATPPPWHMYGLEWSMLIALWAPISVYCGATLFPNDIQRGFERMTTGQTGGLLFVTTPTHLRALLKTQLTTFSPTLPITRILCATAPLAMKLVEEAEQKLQTRIYEIYGCSEAGTLACRNPAQDDDWLLMDAFRHELTDDHLMIDADHLPAPVALPDAVEFSANGRFRLLGRAADLVKVAGKRASLADLTAQLQRIPGVIDAIVFRPGHAGLAPSERVAAFVVAERSSEEIRIALKGRIDPAFMPRPLLRVPDLRRNATGKITREALRNLADACQLP